KLYREERELTVILLVDVSGSQHFGTHKQFKDELVAEICATLSISAIRNNDKVGLICFSDQIEAYIPPRKGSKHVLRVIRELLAIEPIGTKTDIGCALEFLNKVQKKRAIVFLVSDLQDRNWQKQLQIANRRHDVVAVSTNDVSESKLPKTGLMRIEDPETGNTCVIDTSSKRVRRAWNQLANESRIAIEQTLRRSRVDQIKVGTGEPFTNSLRQFFKRREARRA
ncbi:MAG: VWA domain-containing protein, partial [Planctomycetes bacterium]|nr:VWA domain-containing protein [Planctomycetota bacterium]